MFAATATAFAIVPGSVISIPGAVLAFHMLLWAALFQSTSAELAKIRLGLVINDTKGGAIDQGN